MNDKTDLIASVIEAILDVQKYGDLYRAMLKCGIPKDQAKEAILYCKNMDEEMEAEKRAS